MSWKNSALVTSEISRLFVNTLTPHEKHSHRYMQILLQQLQTFHLKKEWLFFYSLLHFWNLHESYNILKKKKKDYPSLIITEIIASEGDVYLNV